MRQFPIKQKAGQQVCFMGRGGGQVVNVLAFNSDDPSSNPAEPYIYSVKCCLKRTKINKKRPVLVYLKTQVCFIYTLSLLKGKKCVSNITLCWLCLFNP